MAALAARAEQWADAGADWFTSRNAEEVRKRHEEIVLLEDELKPLERKQPGTAAVALRKDLRLLEVTARGYLPQPTDRQWEDYAAKLAKNRRA